MKICRVSGVNLFRCEIGRREGGTNCFGGHILDEGSSVDGRAVILIRGDFMEKKALRNEVQI